MNCTVLEGALEQSHRFVSCKARLFRPDVEFRFVPKCQCGVERGWIAGRALGLIPFRDRVAFSAFHFSGRFLKSVETRGAIF